MHDPPLVRVLQGLRHVAAYLNDLGYGQRTALREVRPQRSALHERHRVVWEIARLPTVNTGTMLACWGMRH